MTDERRLLEGIGVSPRVGFGTGRWIGESRAETENPTTDEVDPAVEQSRYESAREVARDSIDRDRKRALERIGENEASVFEAHREFLTDPQLTDAIETAIDDGEPAPRAVKSAFADPIEQFETMDGPMAERADDLRDVRDRLVRTLEGTDNVALESLPSGTVVLAERLTPSETARLDPERVAGFITQTGGRTAHTAIFARSLGIPAVVGIEAELAALDGEPLLVDGEAGTVIVNPTRQEQRMATAGVAQTVRSEPAETRDGQEIEVAANVGTLADLEPAREHGADGIGLFRSEFLFLERTDPPDEASQRTAYRQALEAFPNGRVIFRTLDVGGDKPISYLDMPTEGNPFLGERGIRRSLEQDRDLFEQQLRALCQAGGAVGDDGGTLSIMFPMITTVEECEAALSVLADVLEGLSETGTPAARPDVGVMIETPSAALLAAELADRVDFLSIGTNDLTQYVMAAARENERVAGLHDPLHPPVLRLLEGVVADAHEQNAWVGMCGEMAGEPRYTPLLVGLGFDELSMSAVSIPEVKDRISGIDTAEAEELAEHLLECHTRGEVTAALERWSAGVKEGT